MGGLTGTVTGLKIDGTGGVSFTGGGVELPPIQIAGVNFVALKGSFTKDATGYKFSGGATISLPGLDPSGTAKLTASVTVSLGTQAGSTNELGVIVSFQVGPGKGIPIGGTGAELTGFGGSFNLKAGTATFGVTIKVDLSPTSPLRSTYRWSSSMAARLSNSIRSR